MRAERELARLRGIVRRLRGPGGCPWDRRQTHASLKANLIEETYEVIDAIDRRDARALREELGDLLLQCVFHASIEEDRRTFRLADALNDVNEKLIRRHPHVFGRGKKIGAAEALRQWERLKVAERGSTSRPRGGLDGVPRALPALARAARIQAKAARLGFEWRTFAGAWAKFREESGELDRAIRSRRRSAIRHELGDAFFALAKVARFLNLDPEDELQRANARFIRRFGILESKIRTSGTPMHRKRKADLHRLWRLSKLP
jgi:MazG family protein